MAQTKLKLGDSVVVKPNTDDPDLNINIGGWQGRISEIVEKDNTIGIRWDSITLKQMSDEAIAQCEEQGLDWTEIYLHPEEVEVTNSRDEENDVEEVIEVLRGKHCWDFLGEEGKRIRAVLAEADGDSEWAALEAWEEYFGKILSIPFEAQVSFWKGRGPLRPGDKVRVWGIEGSEDLYGILVSVRHGRKKYVLPLCELEVLDKSSPNCQPVADYSVWFANH